MRYYCNIRIDGNYGNPDIDYKLFKEEVRRLNERIEDLLSDWSNEMLEKKVYTDIGWSWSEHCNL